MGEKKRLIVLWLTLAVLLVGGLVLAAKVGSLTLKPFGPVDVTKVLTTFFVLALFVERTLEVFITAWRGDETAKRENNLQAAKDALAQNPADANLQEGVNKATQELTEYKCETKAIALRAGLVLGILIAAVGVRSFDTFVDARFDPKTFWDRAQAAIFFVLDALVSGGIIGGGSDAIHKMMNIITEFLDATAKKVKTA